MNEADLKAAVTTCDNAIDEARRTRDAAIVQALSDGMKQADVVRATGLNRETIRRIARAAEDS